MLDSCEKQEIIAGSSFSADVTQKLPASCHGLHLDMRSARGLEIA